MNNKKTSAFSNGLIWFGAAISIAEILTGTYVADLGVKEGLLSVFSGHFAGCVLLFLAGIIGAKTEKSAMETTKISFGQSGSYIFSVLNVFQLIGWTAIMINQGADAANAIWGIGVPIWSLILGALIAVWILIGVKNLGIVNTVVMTALFALTLLLSVKLFINPVFSPKAEGASFGSAFELSVAMPMSWLPVIADYTREAEKKTKSTLISVIVYGLASCWMFIIGFFASMFTGGSTISEILKIAGIGAVGIIIVLASTTTTTFLDAFSAGVSAQSIYEKASAKWVGIISCAIGAALSIFAGGFLSHLEGFLYIIAGVFAPMIGIMTADYFILKNDFSDKKVSLSNLIIWAIGLAAYFLFQKANLLLGYTVPVVIGTALLTAVVGKIKQNYRNV